MQSDDLPRILETLRLPAKPSIKWAKAMAAVAAERPSPSWEAMRAPAIDADIARAHRWIVDDLARRDAPRPTRGLFFSVDLCHMTGPAGFNVELFATRGCDPEADDALWIWNCEWRGRRHRIESLRGFCELANEPRFEDVRDSIASVVSLAYAGLVLAEAVSAMEVETPLLALYGSSDGGVHALVRRRPHDVELLPMPLGV